MTDTLMTIIGIFIAVILMILFPLVETAGKNDDIAQTAVQIAASNFVNEVAKEGKITQRMYDELLVRIQATGNMFDVILEARILDENPEKRTVTAGLETTESQYYSVYTNSIMASLRDHGEYLLKRDDYILVTIKNTNTTLGTQLKGVFYKFLGKDTYAIGASASALTINTGVPDRHELAVDYEPAIDNSKRVDWTLALREISEDENSIHSFNLVYILDYSGSMGTGNIERMHNAVYNQLIRLKDISDKNHDLKFNIRLVGFATYSAELMRVTIKYDTNMDDITNRLNYIKSNWQDYPVGLNIPSNPYRSNKDYMDTSQSVTYQHNFTANSQIVGSGTSYYSGSIVGKNVIYNDLKKNAVSKNLNTYVIFMTDGENNDGVYDSAFYDRGYLIDVGKYNSSQYKKYFQDIMDSAKQVYVISYKYNPQHETFKWMTAGENNAIITNSDESNIASIFDNILVNIVTTDRLVPINAETVLDTIDTSKELTITFNSTSILGDGTHNESFIIDNLALNSDNEIADYTFIHYNPSTGKYAINARKLTEHYKPILDEDPENEFSVLITITYYAIST